VSAARTIVATLLIAAVGTAACTGEPEPRRHDDVEGCVFRPTGERVGDVPAGIDGAAADDLWVVGARYKGGTSTPYATRWNGETWRDGRVADVQAEIAGFQDVAVAPEGDAWAVGSLRTREPIAFSWDGQLWSADPLPGLDAVGADEAELYGVAAAGRSVWAVGRSRSGRRWSPLVMERRGGAWERAAAPSPPGVDAALRGVDAVAPNDVWAVGWTAARGGRLGTFAMHYDGDAWRRVPTPGSGGSYDVLASVDAVSADEAWAVGWAIDAQGVDRPLILRWDGTRWSIVPAPEVDGATQLVSVSAPAPDDVWIAGRAKDETQTFTSFVLRRSGEAWSRIPTPDAGDEDDTLVGITVVDRFPWTVGSTLGADQRYRSLVLRGC
jgi:hypothetical protein